MRQALVAPLPDCGDWPAFAANPLSSWIEDTFGLHQDASGILRRRIPTTLAEGARQLAEITQVDPESAGAAARDAPLGHAGAHA